MFHISLLKHPLLLCAMGAIFYRHSLSEYDFTSERIIPPGFERLNIINRENKKKDKDNQCRKTPHDFYVYCNHSNDSLI